LEVDPTCSIADLRKAIETIFSIPITQHRLTCNTRTLDDGQSIADYNIQDESTVHLIPRLLGGKNPRQARMTPIEQQAAQAQQARQQRLRELRARVADAYRRQEALNDAADRVAFDLDSAGEGVEDLRAQIDDMQESGAPPQAIQMVRQRYGAARQRFGALQARMNSIDRDIERIAANIEALEEAIENMED
jgi:large subunit ribosomal protein L40e